MLIVLYVLLSIGATACVELDQYEEAISWCDKGLAVSFDKLLNRESLISLGVPNTKN